jgi:hypothetical protein
MRQIQSYVALKWMQLLPLFSAELEVYSHLKNNYLDFLNSVTVIREVLYGFYFTPSGRCLPNFSARGPLFLREITTDPHILAQSVRMTGI